VAWISPAGLINPSCDDLTVKCSQWVHDFNRKAVDRGNLSRLIRLTHLILLKIRRYMNPDIQRRHITTYRKLELVSGYMGCTSINQNSGESQTVNVNGDAVNGDAVNLSTY
jgi:hypothetical protein